LPAPKCLPSGGNFEATATINFFTFVDGSIVIITIDGTTPTPSNGVFVEDGGSFVVEATETLKFATYRSGVLSSVVTKTFTLDTTIVATPKLSVPGGDYFNFPVSVTISCETSGAEIRYSKSAEPMSDSDGTEYTTAIEMNEGETLYVKAFHVTLDPSTAVQETYNHHSNT
jgi:hypothetical protein